MAESSTQGPSQTRPSQEETLTRPYSGTALPEVSGYRILAKLGEGGMGEVFEAEQLAPVRRRVALKVVKWGMDTKEVIARFESERQALALMNHPSIAGVYDAGATKTGRPFFAMEFVNGVPITEYCDRHRLPTRERLALFTKVCEGVQHAHQKGVIHRDVKPSNVLVKVQADEPVPKIIDFGLAKATAQRLTERTIFTEYGQLVGTPEYMSPEQAEMTVEDVDTRTDVYSLGVLLYELLVGVLPFDSRELRRAGFDEIRRRIREEEPPRPSTRLSRLGDASAVAAERRRSEPQTLAKRLRGDLDWIVMKALEKDRTRRYETADALSLDIERHLGHLPVLASPPSTAYRAKKFVLRHKVGVAAGTLVAVALVLGLAGAGAGLLRARQAEAQAVAEAERANREAATARQVSEFLVELFNVSDPGEARGNSVTAREILDRGAERIRADLAEQPLVQARLQVTMARVYDELGLYAEAEPLLEAALTTRQDVLGDDDPLVAESLAHWGDFRRKQGRYDEAEPLLLRALAIREAALPPDHADIARNLNKLGVLYEQTGRYAEAEVHHERALAIQQKGLDPELDRMNLRVNLAILKSKQGKFVEAQGLFEEALAHDEARWGPVHPQVAISCNNLAISLKLQEKYVEAEPLYLRALAIQEELLESHHPDIAMSLNNLGNVYSHMERFDEAERIYRRAIEVNEGALGSEHADVGRTVDNLASLLADQERYAEAEPLFLRALAIREASWGPRHPEVSGNLRNLGDLYRDLGRYEEAEPYYRRALSIDRELLPVDHPDRRLTVTGYAELLRAAGRDADAASLEASEQPG